MFHIRGRAWSRSLTVGQLYFGSRHLVTLTCLGTRKFQRDFSTYEALVTPFKLADIGEGIAEVELLKWYIKKG